MAADAGKKQRQVQKRQQPEQEQEGGDEQNGEDQQLQKQGQNGQEQNEQDGQVQKQEQNEGGEDGEQKLTEEEAIEAVEAPRETPVLDYKGETKQRSTMMQKKQDELVKAHKRLNHTQTNQSRSASRRARRKRIEQDQTDGKYMHTNSLEALEEADANGELKLQRPFDRIGPDSTSMDGPVTHARAMRGEIPLRGTNPGQHYYVKPEEKQPSALADTDGLKLTLEANLDIEIELKASIRGDLTLSLME